MSGNQKKKKKKIYGGYSCTFLFLSWTAAAVQTLASAMFLKRKEILFLNEVGYEEKRGEHCPFDNKLLQTCSCDFQNTYGKSKLYFIFIACHLFFFRIDFDENSCTVDLLRYISPGTIEEMANFARFKLSEQ